MLTALEKLFDSPPDAFQIRPQRDDRFDYRSGLFFSPITYATDPLTASEAGSTSTSESLRTFVRDEFSSRASEALARESAAFEGEAHPIDFLAMAREIVSAIERQHVYGTTLRELESDLYRAGADSAQSLYQFFYRSAFGRKENEANLSPEWFAERLAARSDSRVGLHFVVPCLPYRDQNPFRCPNSPATATIAEAVFLGWLHSLTLAIYRLVPGGSHVVCLSDGTLYADALGVDRSLAAEYLVNMRRLRDALNIERKVSILDLRAIAEGVAMARGESFDEAVEAVAGDLRGQLDSGSREVLTSIVSLVAGLRWNVDATRLADDNTKLAGVLAADPEELVERGLAGLDESSTWLLHSSLRYAAINLVLRRLDVVGSVFPETVRLTMHPKHGQAALRRFGRVFPWNGVACVDCPNYASIDTIPMHEIRNRAPGLVRALRDERWSDEILGFQIVQ